MGILTVLQSHQFVTAEKIAGKFEISVRTVYRDIKALGEIGIPVSFENNKGYFIVRGYFLPPVAFTTEEANALVLTASLAERFGDKSIARHSSQALQKIRAVLRSPDREWVENLDNRIRVLNPGPHPPSYLLEIQKSISTNTILHINYTDKKQNRTSRELEPIGMIYYTDQWHLVAWCWTRNDYRDFIVKQISGLKNTSETFRKINHITVDEYIRSWN
jgi:predicted DNA-binding transcriptional regulator YafY